MKQLFELFYSFFKIGSLTFGGGYAMLPILEREVVNKKKWVSREELLDSYALSQCTPGVIAVNVSTMIGYRKHGIFGGIMAALGVVCPSLIVIIIIAAILPFFINIDFVSHAFNGIRVAVAALILSAILSLWKSSIVDWLCILVFIASFGVMYAFDISPVYIIILSALFGIIIKMIRGAKQ